MCWAVVIVTIIFQTCKKKYFGLEEGVERNLTCSMKYFSTYFFNSALLLVLMKRPLRLLRDCPEIFWITTIWFTRNLFHAMLFFFSSNRLMMKSILVQMIKSVETIRWKLASICCISSSLSIYCPDQVCSAKDGSNSCSIVYGIASAMISSKAKKLQTLHLLQQLGKLICHIRSEQQKRAKQHRIHRQE